MSIKIDSAKQNISRLRGEIDGILNSKNDSTIAAASASGGASAAAAAIRAPPQTRTRRTLKGHYGKITALHWGGDSRSLVSASQDGNLLLWNACTSNKLGSITLKSSYVMSVGIEQKGGNLIASGGLDNLCTIFNLSTGSSNANTTAEPTTAAHELASHDGFLSCCRFISEQQIVTSSGDSSCILWDIPTGRVLETFREHEETAMYLSLRPDDPNVFASCSVDKTAKVWDVRTPDKSTMTFAGHLGDLNCIDFMPCDGNTFATCSNDGTARVWDMRSYQELAKFGTIVEPDPFDPNPGITSVAFSRSGRLLFAGHCDSSVLTYDVLMAGKTDGPAFTINDAHEYYVSCLGVSPDGSALCTGSWDCNLKVWA